MSFRQSIRHSPLLVAALAALTAGILPVNTMSLTNNAAQSAAQLASQNAAIRVGMRQRSKLPAYLLNSGSSRGGMFKHFTLSQRHRRKFNRQRFAGGDRRAFA
jgi:hypothetical protein